MVAIVDPSVADAAVRHLNDRGSNAWVLGTVARADAPADQDPDYVQGAKGVDGGAVRMVGSYA